MSCLLCGGKDGPTYVGSGYSNICDECREALLHYKKSYYTNKALTETTDLDEQVFEILCKSMQLDQMVDEEKDSILPETLDVFISSIKEIVTNAMGKEPWLNGQPGRFDNFLKYIEKKIREKWNNE